MSFFLRHIAIAFALCLTCAQASAAEWVKAESPNFIVYSDAGARHAEAYVRNLEKYRYVIGAFYRKAGEPQPPSARLQLYLVRFQGDLIEVWPRVTPEVYGFVRACRNGMTGYAVYDDEKVKRSGPLDRQMENDSQTILFHEYAHIFMFQNMQKSYPRWYIEGAAEFYSTARVQDNQAVIGMPWSDRVWGVRDDTSLKWEDVLRSAPSTQKPAAGSDFYAQSWLLTHWILSDPTRTKAFGVFIDAQNAGKDPVEAFEAAFGVPVRDLNRTLYAYLSSIRATVYTFKNLPSPDIRTSDMPASASRLLLWDSVASACISESDKPIFLSKIRAETAKYPTDAFALRTQARAEIMIGDAVKGLEFYLRDTKAHPDDAEGFFRLGQAWFRLTLDEQIQPSETPESQMHKARDAFARAHELDPLNAVNLYLLSVTALQTGKATDPLTVSTAYDAHRLAPSITDYAVHAAYVLLLNDDTTRAHRVLLPLANNAHNPGMAQWATRIVTAIDAGAARPELLRLMNSPDEAETEEAAEE